MKITKLFVMLQLDPQLSLLYPFNYFVAPPMSKFVAEIPMTFSRRKYAIYTSAYIFRMKQFSSNMMEGNTENPVINVETITETIKSSYLSKNLNFCYDLKQNFRNTNEVGSKRLLCEIVHANCCIMSYNI